MNCWTLNETIKWLHSLNVSSQNGQVIIDETWTVKQFDLPKESYAQAELSRTFIELIEPFKGCVLCLTEWGVFPSEDNPILIERFRLSYGETRPLSEAPTFHLEPSEEAETIALIRLLIMFSWDGYLVSPTGDVVLMITGHERFADLCTRGK
jgi:hypothetical protein